MGIWLELHTKILNENTLPLVFYCYSIYSCCFSALMWHIFSHVQKMPGFRQSKVLNL